MRSQFLNELPEELLNTRNRSSHTQRKTPAKAGGKPYTPQNWQVGDKVLHRAFGIGEITHVFGQGNKVSVAIKFASLGQKIVDPQLAQLQRVDH
jgi:DNA helicase II / ATP-dependent DNA helicase PcrA